MAKSATPVVRVETLRRRGWSKRMRRTLLPRPRQGGWEPLDVARAEVTDEFKRMKAEATQGDGSGTLRYQAQLEQRGWDASLPRLIEDAGPAVFADLLAGMYNSMARAAADAGVPLWCVLGVRVNEAPHIDSEDDGCSNA